MADPVSLYLDEDVSVLVGEMLRARGIDVLTTRDAKNLGVNDEDQLRFAIMSGRIFLTHNRVDFERLALQFFNDEYDNPGIATKHSGIIIAVRRPARELTLKILFVLRELTAREMAGQIRYI